MSRGCRSGFTLPEILVTVSVVGVLAAAVVPAVTEYVNKGNEPASQPDVQRLQTAIAGFTADVRHYPGDLQQLVTPIVSMSGSGDSLDFDGSATPVQFTAMEVSRWKGPYTSATISTGTTAGGQLTSDRVSLTIGRKVTLSSGWLTVRILKPRTCAAILALDESIDKASAGAGNEGTEGVVIWTGTCHAGKPHGTVMNPVLRVGPAN